MRETRASQKVRAWTDEHSQQALAQRLTARLGRKVHQATVSAWGRGEYAPTGIMMAALQAEIGIEFGDWLVDPDTVSDMKAGDAIPSPDASGDLPAVSNDEPERDPRPSQPPPGHNAAA